MKYGWMNRVRYLARRLKRIKTWHMVVTFVVLLVLSMIFLRMNNVAMVELRDQLITADASGDQTEINQAAEQLRFFVSNHMNTDTGQIALQESYNRAVAEAFEKVNNDVDSSGYAVATENCKAVLTQSGYQGYANCVASMVGVSEASFAEPELPNPAMFYLSFASPLISFDLTGVIFILTTVVFIAIFLKALTEVVLQAIIYFREKRVKIS